MISNNYYENEYISINFFKNINLKIKNKNFTLLLKYIVFHSNIVVIYTFIFIVVTKIYIYYLIKNIKPKYKYLS